MVLYLSIGFNEKVALCHSFAEPLNHLLAFLPALDLQQTAVLLAISVHIAEGTQELLELTLVHDICNHVNGDICELVGVNSAEEVGQLFLEGLAHIDLATCQSETGGLDAHIEFGNVAVHIEGNMVMLADLASQGEGQSLFAVVAPVGVGACDVGNSNSSHNF